MKHEFKKLSIVDFDNQYGTALNSFMTFDEAMLDIEENEINYFYTSLNIDDVIEAITDEEEITNQLNLDLIYINDIGIYIAIIN